MRDAKKNRAVLEKPVVEGDEEVRKLYSERLVAKLEKKMLELEESERKLCIINRSLETLRRCNRVLVRATDKIKLLNEICRIIVDIGGHRAAWVGIAEQDKDKSVLPVAQAGYEEGYSNTPDRTWADSEQIQSPVRRAIRTKENVIIRDILTNPDYRPLSDEAKKRGYASTIILPLIADEHVLGVLNIYAAKPDAFGMEEVKLLTELADDMAFGIMALQTRASQRLAEEELRKSEARFRSYFDLPLHGVAITSPAKGWLQVNDKLCAITGYSRDELVRMTWAEITHPDDLAADVEQFTRLLAGQIDQYDLDKRFIRKDRKVIWVSLNVGCVRLFDGSVDYVVALLEDITEHKKTIEALRVSENRFRALFATSLDALFLTSPDGQIFAANDAACCMFGRSEDELKRVGRDGVVDLSDPRLPESLAIRERTGKFRGELMFLRSDGTKFLGEISYAIFGGQDGRLHTSMSIRDITERKHAEEALRESEIKYKELYDDAPVGYHELDREGRIVRINKTEVDMLGYLPEEMIGRPLFDFIVPEQRERSRNYFEAIISGKQAVIPFERKCICKNGTSLDVLVELKLVHDSLGQKSGMRVTVQDITERKKAEKSRILLEAAIEQAAEYILITDADGKIQYVNPAFEKINGYKSEEVVGRNPSFLKSGVQDEAFYKEMWDTIKGGGVWRGRLINRKKDGSLYHEEGTIFPIRDVAGRISNFVAVKNDVTQEMELENQLRHSQKMESIGLLAGGIAHDFNNILTTVLGYSSMMKTAKDSSEKSRYRAGEIDKAAQRGADIARQLLMFSRKKPPKLETLNLSDIINQSLNFLKSTIGPTIAIKYYPEKNLNPIDADNTQIQQILMNLAVNARDAMPGGGNIVIRTENVLIDQNYVQNHIYAKPGPYVLLTFSDNGIGMDKKTQRRIFEPFFTTKAIGKGTGLGLSMVYGLVKNHKGLVHVYSELGKGTIFKIYFPLSTGTASAAVKEEAPVKGGHETILVVDDEEMILNMVLSILEDYGYSCLSAESGVEAIKIYEENREKIDLVLLDLIMPKIGGPAVFEKIKTVNPRVKVIMSSGFLVQDEAELSTTGVKAFVSKPYQARYLAQKVREVLDGDN